MVNEYISNINDENKFSKFLETKILSKLNLGNKTDADF